MATDAGGSFGKASCRRERDGALHGITGKVGAWLPAILVSVHLLAGILYFAVGSSMVNDGHLVYTLDDPYIHMAIAKNLVTHGVFGVTQYAFTSATSSPLWTLLIALSYAISGIHEATAFVLAAAAAMLCVFAADRLAARFNVGPWPRAAMGLALVYLTPLCTLVSTGLEHGLHIFWVLLELGLVMAAIAAPLRTKRAVALCAVSFLAVATRYESMFLVFPLALVLALHRRIGLAVLMLISAAMPVLLYGMVSLAHGSEFLPNSLLLKGNFVGIHGVGSFFDFIGIHGIKSLLKEPHLLALTAALLVRAAMGKSQVHALRWVQLATAMAVLAHLQWAQAGWFYRYEAYLVAAALALLGLDLLSQAQTKTPQQGGAIVTGGSAAAVVLGLIVLWPLQVRARHAWQDMLPGSHDIFEQQYQMGRFFSEMLPDRAAVAVNDLGAVSFFTDRPIVDLWGLGSIDVARAKRHGTYDTAGIIAVLARHNVEYICVYPNWFLGELALPPHLVRVGTWRNPLDASGGGHTVVFLAADGPSAKRLSHALYDFAARLPWSVYGQIFLPDDRAVPRTDISPLDRNPAINPDISNNGTRWVGMADGTHL